MENRQIIQIIAPVPRKSDYEADIKLWALCDDGTVWYLVKDYSMKWTKAPEISQI